MAQRVGRFFACLLLCALALLCALPAAADDASPFTPEEQAYIDAHGPLRVGYVADRIPVSFEDENGELAGISRAIFDRVAELSGLTFTYEALPGGAVTYDYLLEHKLDLVTSVESNPENENANGILISDPYLTSRKVVVARQDLEFSVDKHLRVAVSSGSQTLRKVLARAYPNFTLEDHDTITDCFDAVKNGEADLLILNQFVVEYWIGKPAYAGLKVIPVIGMDDTLCFSAVVAYDERGGMPAADGALLIGILNKSIAMLDPDLVGSYTIAAIMENQYTFTLQDFLYRYRHTVWLLAAAVVIISTLAVLLLRQRVRSMQDRADAKAKEQFLSTMSHEIRTPLHGLIGLNYLMERRLDDPGQMSAYLRQSTATAHYLLALVNDILDMSKLQADKMELAGEPVDLPLLIETVDSIVRSAMEEKQLTFTVETDLPCPCVLGDENRIQQVLMNLLDNARKFTPAGGTVTLRVSQQRGEDGAVTTRMEVTDTGRGMSEAFQKVVFDPFAQEREQNTVSKGNGGTGLGLPICRRLADAMHGTLTLTSQKGKGSCFVFTFPSRQAAMPAGAPAPDVPPKEAAKPCILIAEDNELNREIMQEMLSLEGYPTLLAEDGQQALEMFTAAPEGQIRIILMDLLMPRLDGYAAAAAIRALPRADAKTVRIIACTANSFAEDRERALKTGMDDFVAKPVDVKELLQKLQA